MRGYSSPTALRLVASAAAVALVAMASPAMAQTRVFDVPAGVAARAIPLLARQAGIQILARADVVGAKRTKRVRGTYTVDEALRLLLQGTGLKAEASPGGIFMISGGKAKDSASLAQHESGELDVIVVTARFVSENAQSTPMAISARTSRQMAASNVTNVGTLGALVPNLWTVPGDARSAGTPIMTMRGVRQGDSSSYAAPPAVAIYNDDVYHATGAGSDLDFTDVDHVEVHRGPQSTLSGNASIGGSIKIYTTDPKGDGSGYVALTGGSREKFGVSGAIDLSLAPTLAIRLSGNFQRQTGWVDRLDFTCQMRKQGTPQLAGSLPLFQPDSPNRDCVIGTLGGINHTVGQMKLRWRLDDKLGLILNVRKRQERDEETPEIALAYQPNPDPNPNVLVQIMNKAFEDKFGIRLDSRFLPPADRPLSTYATNCRTALPLNGMLPPVNGIFVQSGFCYDRTKSANHMLLSAKLLYRFSDKTRMTAIGAYTEYDNAFTAAGDQSPLTYQFGHFVNRAYQKSGELRFDGKLFEDRLNWVIGGFLLRLTGYQGNAGSVAANSALSSDTARVESQSGFFHLDYNLTDRWRVSGGARYTEGKLIYQFDHPPLLTVPDPFASPQKRWDWLLSTDYRIGDDVLVYASAATGSRPPGIVTIINKAEQFLPTPGEDLISYEIGMKADLFDERLRANLAAFYTDYKLLGTSVVGVQCLGQPGTATWFATRTDCNQFADASFVGWNFPIGVPATVRGFEWEVTALPVEGLRIDWSGGYNNYKSGVTTPGAPGYLWPGNHRQPIWNMHANASYDLVTAFGTFTPRLDVNWQSQQDFDTTSAVRPPLPVFIVRPYSLWNAQFAFNSQDGSWSATLAITNLMNRFHSFQKLNGTLTAQTRVGPPREISLTLRRTF